MRINARDIIEISVPVIGGILGFAGAVYSLRGESDKGRAMLASWAVVTSIVSVMDTYNSVMERRLVQNARLQQYQTRRENLNASI
jgi:hypothetical protein